MSVYSFSTKDSKPTDTEVVERTKRYCKENGVIFGTIVVKALAKWWESKDAKDEQE